MHPQDTCPHCGRPLTPLMTAPLAICAICQRTYTRYGDRVTADQLTRYTQAAKAVPVPAEAWDESRILANTTQTPQDFRRTVQALMNAGFSHDEALRLITLRAEYAAGIWKQDERTK